MFGVFQERCLIAYIGFFLERYMVWDSFVGRFRICAWSSLIG